jgi:hypothetical protein
MHKVLDRKNKVLTLYKHHLKGSVITRLKKNYLTVYDIEIGDYDNDQLKDFNNNDYIIAVLHEALRLGYPVLLHVDNITRLLIFNRSV